jgi:lipoprotein-anchoring transpeptidase ErfK/SrfK
MPPRSLLSSIVLAGVAAVSFLTAPKTANAQGLIDFLWGGGTEWGGSRQTIEFSRQYTPGQIIVSFGDRRLYLINRKGQAISYPIAVPREQSRWQGTTTVSDKRTNPSWRPTPDMLRENPKLPSWVPGGHPMNPLGVRAMYLGGSTYRIHGTDAPWTIGQAVSKGCIRMFNEDVLDLYPRVPVGMKVTVTWQRFGTPQAVASGYDAQGNGAQGYDDGPATYELSGYKNNTPRRRVLRNLPPMTQEDLERAQTAAVRMEPASHDIPHIADNEMTRRPAASRSGGSSKSQSQGSSKPADAAKSAGTSKPAEASKPVEASKSTDASKPVEPPKTAEATKPADTSKPADASKSAEASKPADASKSTDAPKPADAAKSADASKPADASRPADTSKAADASKSAETSKSADSKPAAMKSDAQKSHGAAATGTAMGPVEAAKKAAEAATKAAEAAREAAEVAKKAAADAKKATSTEMKPEKASAKSAAL